MVVSLQERNICFASRQAVRRLQSHDGTHDLVGRGRNKAGEAAVQSQAEDIHVYCYY